MSEQLPPTRVLQRSGGRRARLIIEASERDSDLLYASRFLATDPFTYIEYDGRSYLILSDLELGRGTREAQVDHVISYSELEAQVQEEQNVTVPSFEDVVIRFLKNEGIQDLLVPPRFGTRYADRLREDGFKVEVGDDPFYPGRAVKSVYEISCIELAQADTEAVMTEAIDQIRRSEIRDGSLYLDGEALTAERLKRFVRLRLIERDYEIGDFIVAAGDQGCDPHNTGSGHLPANQPIIIDIFPRHMQNHYWGDMTRTVVKGQASSQLTKLHRSVAHAQKEAIAKIRPGVTGAEVHQHVQECFASDGFPTERRNGTMVGFFHGTGHGIGLDIHETPRLAKNGPELKPGMVVTVEPGLYYPGMGGVRIEDVVVVTEDGCRNLNSASRELLV